MATARRVKDILADKASQNFAGRQEELAELLQCLHERGPVVTWVHGMAGIGKSALLGEFQTRAMAAGADVIALDGRFVEPTPEGFQRALGGVDPGRATKRLVLVIDAYESFLLIDGWLRQTYIPELSESVRLVFASRYPPGAAWLLALEWQGLLKVMQLREMPVQDALELLKRSGVGQADAERLNRFARGNPLALRLAIASLGTRSGEAVEEGAAQAVVRQLAALYLESVLDPASRAALEAASVVYRFTRSLANAMLPDAPADTYDRLADSCFVYAAHEGLMVHDAVRDAVAGSLRVSDPHRFQTYRQTAWRLLREEARSASRERMWGYTSGMIFLLQNPVVREAFVPSASPLVSVEPAGPTDGASILGIGSACETGEAAAILGCWWEQAPWTFRVVRDAPGTVSGFYIYAELRDDKLPRMDADPMMRAWRRHLRTHPVPKEQTVVFLRRWLSAEHGELPSPVQAACWLDVKRSYMELRPRLRRCYLSLCDLAAYGPTAKRLGFQIVEGAAVTMGGVTHHLAVLDFGPGSVDGWLTGLVAEELGVKTDGILDLESRELVMDNLRVPLTTLEFELLRHLQERAGKAVSREELLAHIWGRRADASSNVVDVVVRSLRKKMGTRSAQLATVRGHGYRLGAAR